MKAAETIWNHEFNRRDLLDFSFARRKDHRTKGRPTTREKKLVSISRTPQPPRWDRRQFLAGSAMLTAGVAAAVLLKPWEWLAPDTLESLVTQARKMEGEFRDDDLSDESKRNNYTAILADIYSKDSPSNWTKQKIAQSLIWTKNTDEFISVVITNSQRRRGEKGRDYFTDVPMLTTDNKKVVVNLTNPAFDTSHLRQRISKDWNALKSLRRFLLHEFTHLTTTPKRDREFFNLTDLPKDIENPYIDGFILQFSQAEHDGEAFHILNELVVETIATERSNKLFGLTPPIPYIEQGIDLRTAQTRLRQILAAAKINILDLEKYNKTSDFYDFLTNLSSKINFPSNTSVADRINYVLSVLDAVLYNDRNLIQEYITKATTAKDKKPLSNLGQ